MNQVLSLSELLAKGNLPPLPVWEAFREKVESSTQELRSNPHRSALAEKISLLGRFVHDSAREHSGAILPPELSWNVDNYGKRKTITEAQVNGLRGAASHQTCSFEYRWFTGSFTWTIPGPTANLFFHPLGPQGFQFKHSGLGEIRVHLQAGIHCHLLGEDRCQYLFGDATVITEILKQSHSPSSKKRKNEDENPLLQFLYYIDEWAEQSPRYKILGNERLITWTKIPESALDLSLSSFVIPEKEPTDLLAPLVRHCFQRGRELENFCMEHIPELTELSREQRIVYAAGREEEDEE